MNNDEMLKALTILWAQANHPFTGNDNACILLKVVGELSTRCIKLEDELKTLKQEKDDGK